jgi:predicted nucleic acid-binding protein
MTRALLDATVVIAAVDEDDEDHETGLEIVQAVDHGELPKGIIVSDALQESLNFVHERKGHAAAVDVLDRFVRGARFEIPYNPKKNYGEARSLFRSDGELNFGDSLQVAYMRSSNIEYIYSFDDDYDGVDGIERLNAAVNPYN